MNRQSDSSRNDRPPAEAAPGRHPFEVQVLSRYFVRWKAILVVVLTVFISVVAAYLVLNASPRFAVGAVGVMVAGVVIFLKPQVGFWAYYIMAFARPHEVLWGFEQLRISLGLAAFTLIASFASIATSQRPFLRRDPILSVMLAFNAVVLISAVIHDGNYERLTEMSKILLFAVMFAVYVDRRSWVKVTIWVMTLSFAYLTIWAILQKYVHGVYMLEGPGTLSATLKDRNYFAMHLLLGIPFYWYLAQRTRLLLVKLAAWGMMPLAVLAVFLTASRGGLLGVAGAMGAIAWQSPRRVLALTAGGILLVGFYVVAAPETLKSRADTIVHYEGEASAEGRINSWRAGSKMLLANPLFGVGPANYVRNYRFYDSSRPRQAHNTLVQTGGEYGFFGLILLISYHVLTFRRLIRLRERGKERNDKDLISFSKTLIASQVAFWVAGSFLSAERYELMWFFGPLAVAISTSMAAWSPSEEEEGDEPMVSSEEDEAMPAPMGGGRS